MFELTITVKDSESTYKKKFMVYEPCQVSEDDPTIKRLIHETLREFGKPAEEAKYRISGQIADLEMLPCLFDEEKDG